MKNSPYKRRPGDSEIRILTDGRVVMIAPNEKLLEVAQVVDPDSCALPPRMETRKYARIKKHKGKYKRSK